MNGAGGDPSHGGSVATRRSTIVVTADQQEVDTSMAGLIYTLEEDRKSIKRKNVEWFDKVDIDVDYSPLQLEDTFADEDQKALAASA